jgi:hypothetical protein
VRELPPYDPLRIHDRFRYESLLHQFSPHGRTRVRLDNVDQVKVGDVLRYNEDHGYQGSWDVTGTVVKITDKSLVLEKQDVGSARGRTSRIAKDDRLARRRVVRLGTAAELAEYNGLQQRIFAQEAHERRWELIAQERERVQAVVDRRAKDELFKELIQDHETRQRLDYLAAEIAKEYIDCPKCQWPGRKVDQGCLHCSDGF